MYNNVQKRNSNYQQPRNNKSEQKIRLEFVKSGYRKDGILREKLIIKEAKDISEDLYNNGSGLSSSQLRAFFNEVKAIQNRINNDEQKFNQNYPFILMLKSKAAYKYRNGGQNSKITEQFYDFINASVDYIKENKSMQTFNDFVLFFETIVGYYYGLGAR